MSTRTSEALGGGLARVAGTTRGGVAIGVLVGESLAFAHGELPPEAPTALRVALHALAIYALGAAVLRVVTAPVWALVESVSIAPTILAALGPAERFLRRVKLEDLSSAEVEKLRSPGYVR